MKLHSRIDLDAAREVYAEHRRVLIGEFLQPRAAAKLSQSFESLAANDLWFINSYGDPTYFEPQYEGKDAAAAHFSYRFASYPLTPVGRDGFLRAANRRKPFPGDAKTIDARKELARGHSLLAAARFFNSREVVALMSEITGHDLKIGGATVSASRYMAGDYLSAHDDNPGGKKIAYILYLTPRWLPHWGGQLSILDDQYEEIVESYAPRFNSLVIFDVPLPHVVLPVAAQCPSARHAIFGWFH